MGQMNSLCMTCEFEYVDKPLFDDGFVSIGADKSIESRYNFGPLIAEGRTGKVFIAHRRASPGKETPKKVAIKRLHRGIKDNRVAYKQEVNILEYLGYHPNIVLLGDTDLDPKYFYIVTNLCSGGDLFDKVVNHRDVVTESQAASWMYQTLDALAFCHERNVAHRDVKPENMVFLSKLEASPIVLIDFGCAVQVEDEATYGNLGGTVYYCAPEIVRKDGGGPNGAEVKKADVWAAGVVAYWIMTLCVPFFGNTPEEICNQILNDRLEFPPSLNASQSFKHFIAQLLEKDATKRISAKRALKHPWLQMYAGVDGAQEDDDVEEDDEEAEGDLIVYQL